MDELFEKHLENLRDKVMQKFSDVLLEESSNSEAQLETQLSIYTEELFAQFLELQQAHQNNTQITEKLKKIFNTTPNGMVICERVSSRILDINPTALKLLNTHRNQLKNMLASYFPAGVELNDFEFDNFYAWFANEHAGQLEISPRPGHWLQLEKVMMSDEDQLIVTLVDITALKQAEIKIIAANNMLQTFIKHAPAAIAMFDTDMRYLQASQKWLQIYQLDADIVGKSHYDLLDTPTSWKKLHQRGLKGEILIEENDSMILADGSVQWLRWEIHPWYLSEGSIGGILLFIEDKTQNFEFQSERIELLQKAKVAAEESNQQKSQFLANISHELRTPMHAIMSFSHLGKKTASDPKSLRYFDNIRESGQRLTHLLDNLLDLAKFESGRMPIKFARGNIRNLLDQAVREVQSLLDDKQLTVNLLGEQVVDVEMDYALIMQVMINQLSNAIKFSPVGAEIEIAYSRKSLNIHKTSLQIMHLEIRDYGIGIPAQEVESIFDKFIQSSKTSTGAGGTGLGLAISRQIVEQHHGSIYAVSPPPDGAKGSVIVIELPIQQYDMHKATVANLYAYHEDMQQQIEAMLEDDKAELSQGTAIYANHVFCRMHDNPNFSHLPSRSKENLQSLHQSFHALAGKIVSFYDKNQHHQARELLPNFRSNAKSFLNILRAIEQQQEMSSKQAESDNSVTSPLILLVDDSKVIQITLQGFLEDAGYRVVTAENGLEAIAKLDQFHPNLMITDIYMPVQNGLKTIMDALAKRPDLPIIAMSAGGEQEHFGPLYKSSIVGASIVMEKPIHHDELLKNVKTLVA